MNSKKAVFLFWTNKVSPQDLKSFARFYTESRSFCLIKVRKRLLKTFSIVKKTFPPKCSFGHVRSSFDNHLKIFCSKSENLSPDIPKKMQKCWSKCVSLSSWTFKPTTLLKIFCSRSDSCFFTFPNKHNFLSLLLFTKTSFGQVECSSYNSAQSFLHKILSIWLRPDIFR